MRILNEGIITRLGIEIFRRDHGVVCSVQAVIRWARLAPLFVLLIALAGCAGGRRPVEVVPAAFEEQFNAWAKVANARAERTGLHGVDVRERELWEKTKQNWRRFEATVDRNYR